MKLRLRPVFAALFTALLTAAAAQEPNDKARKYFDALVKRPAPGVVFDRFYDAWLDSGTLEELEAWLLKGAAAPNDAAGRMILALFYSRQNDHPRAAAAFEEALKLTPDNATAWHLKALAESRALDYTAALASIEKGLALPPEAAIRTKLLQLKGRLLARSGKPDEALKVWQQLVDASPGDTALQEDLIEFQLAEGLDAAALATAEKLLAATTDPYQKVQRRLRVGDLHARSGNREAAIAAYVACLDDTGTNSWLEKEILSQLEQTYRRDDALEACRTHFAALAEQYPQRPGILQRHARLLAESGDVQGAVDAFTGLLALVPGDRAVQEAYIELLTTNQRHAEAAAQLQELLKLQPQDAELAARLAEVEHAAGQPEKAKAAVAEFLKRAAPGEASQLRAAAILERCKLSAEALAQLQSTAQAFPQSETAAEALATALHRADRKDEAAAAWRALASGADKTRLTNVARSAAARGEHGLAWELLSSRAAEFQEDALFLTQLCDTALRTEKAAEALPWARRLVTLSKDPAALEPALVLAIRLADRAGQLDALTKDLAASTSPQELCLLAELHEKAGRRPESDAALQQVTATAPELATALRVRLFTARGDLENAARALEAQVKSPGGQKALTVQRLVELYARGAKFTEALQWIPEWKKLAPGSADPWQQEASLLAAQGRTADALRVLRQATALFEENEQLKTALASALRSDGKPGDAMHLLYRLYEDAQEIPDKVRLAGELASAAQDAEKLPDLIENFEERRRSNRTSLAPLLALAEIHRVTENYEARRAAMLEAARLAPDNKDLRLEIIRMAESEGDWDRAIQSLRDLQAAQPDPKLQMRLAGLLYNAGRESEALALMQEFAAAPSLDARAAEGMAQPLAAAQAWPECVALLQTLRTRFPKDYRLAWMHAVALEENGDSAAALAAFLHLLTLKDEIPAAPAATQPSRRTARNLASQTAYQNLLTRLVPEVSTFLQHSVSLQAAYSYRRRINGSVRLSAAAGLPLPGKVEEVPMLVLPHLKELTAGDEAQRKAAIAALSAAGVSPAEEMLALAPGSQRRSPEPLELYQQYPQSAFFRSLAAAYCVMASRGRVNPPIIVALVTELRPTRPDLADLVALTLLSDSTDPEHIALGTAAVERLLPRVEKEPELRAYLINTGNRMGSSSRPALGRDLPPALQKVNRWLLAEFLAGKLDPYERSMALYRLASALHQEKDWAALMQLLDSEMAQSLAAPAPGFSYSRSTSGNAGQPGSPLGFPVVEQDVPVGIQAILEINGYSNGEPGIYAMPAEAILPLLPEMKSPLLRVLLATKTKDDAATTAAADELLKITSPTLSEVLLAAGWKEKQQDYDGAWAALAKAPQPWPPAQRERFDGLAITWAMLKLKAAATPPAEDDPLIKAGREAALRLSRKAAPSRRETLAHYLEKLGLEAEAARLREMKTQQPAVARQPAPPQPGEKLEALLKANRREDALRLLTRELQVFVRQWPQISANGSTEQHARWLKAVKEANLVEDVLKAVDPGETNEFNALQRWGTALEIMDDKVRAAAAYRKALDLRPKHRDMFQLWLKTALRAQPAEVGAVLGRCTPEDFQGIESVMANMSHCFARVPERMAALEALGNWLEALPAEKLPSQELSWAVTWLTRFRYNEGYAEDHRYGNLLGSGPRDKDGNPTDNPAPEDAKLTARWRAAAEKTGLLLCRVEANASAAFVAYSGLKAQPISETDAGELDALATQVLERHLAGRARRSSGASFFQLTGSQSDHRSYYPGEWMLERAMIRKQPESLRGVIAKLRTAGETEPAQLLESILDLALSPEAEFSAATRKFIALSGNRYSPGPYILRVIDTAIARQITPDLTPLLLEGLPSENNTNPAHEQVLAVARWAGHLKARSGYAQAGQFFTQLAEKCMGPLKDRASFLAAEYNANRVSSNSPNGRIHFWLNLVNAVQQDADVSFLAQLSLDREFIGLLKDPSGALERYSPSNSPALAHPIDAKALRRYWNDTPAVADLAAFDLPMLTSRYGSSIPKHLLEHWRRSDTAAKALAEEPATFGTGFLIAALAKEPEAALLTHLGTHIEAIQKLPVPRQIRLAAVFRASFSPGDKSVPASPLVDKARAWLAGIDNAKSLEGLDRILAAPKASDIAASPARYAREVRRALQIIIRQDPEKALALFLHVRAQIAADHKAGTTPNFNGDPYNGDLPKEDRLDTSASHAGAALTTVMRHTQAEIPAGDPLLPRVIAAFTAMMATSGGVEVESNREIAMQLGGLLLKAGTPPEKDAKFNLQRLVTAVGPVLKPEWMPALLGPSRHVMWMADVKGQPEAIAWLEHQTKDGPHPDFARLLLAGAVIGREEQSPDKYVRTGILSADQLTGTQQWLVACLVNPTVPDAQMAAFAAESLRQWPAAEPALRIAAMHALARTLSPDVPIEESYIDLIVEQFLALGKNHTMPEDEAIRAAGAAVAKAWQFRLKWMSSSTTDHRYGWNRVHLMDRLLLRRMLYLALITGNAAEANGIARFMEDPDVARYLTPAWPGILVFFRQFEAARRLLKQESSGYFQTYRSGGDIGWDYKAGVHEALPDFLATIPDVNERYRAEVILRGLPGIDSEGIGGPLKGKCPDRAGRLLALAKTWPAPELLRAPDGPRLLNFLYQIKGADEALAPALDAFNAGQKLSAFLPGQRSSASSSDPEPAVLTALARRRLAAGDLASVLTFFREGLRPSQAGSSISYNNAACVGAVWVEALPSLQPHWQAISDAERSELRKLGLQLLLDRSVMIATGNRIGRGYSHFFTSVAWLYLVTGELATFEKDLLPLLDGPQRGLRQNCTYDTLPFPRLLQPWPADAPDAAAKRSKLWLDYMLRTRIFPGTSQYGNEWLKQQVDAGWLLPSDVLARAGELLDAVPDRRTRLYELTYLVLQEKDAAVRKTLLEPLVTAALKDPTGGEVFLISETCNDQGFNREAQDSLDVLDLKPAPGLKLSDDTLYHLPIKRVHLKLEEIARSQSRPEADKAAAALLQKTPVEGVTWAGLAWAYLNMSRWSAEEKSLPEAWQRSALSFLFSQTAAKVSSGKYKATVDWGRNDCRGHLKALKRDEKEADALTTRTGIQAFAKEAPDLWNTLPEAARQLIIESADKD